MCKKGEGLTWYFREYNFLTESVRYFIMLPSTNIKKVKNKCVKALLNHILNRLGKINYSFLPAMFSCKYFCFEVKTT